MHADDQAAYLARLGARGRATVGRRAHPPAPRPGRAGALRDPVDPHRPGAGASTSTSRSARIANVRRGGYCFHLNGAFSVLLESLGYQVTRHVGGVHGPVAATEQEMANHLVLRWPASPPSRTPTAPGTSTPVSATRSTSHPARRRPVEQPPFRMRLDETPGDDRRLAPHPRCRGRLRRDGVALGARRRSTSSAGSTSGSPPRPSRASSASSRSSGATPPASTSCAAGPQPGRARARRGRPRHRAELEDVLIDLFRLDLATIDPDALAAMWTACSASTSAGSPPAAPDPAACGGNVGMRVRLHRRRIWTWWRIWSLASVKRVAS